MRAVLVLLLVAGTASAGPLPRHYAKLFDATAAWTYEVTLTTWDYDQIQHEDNPRKWKKKTEPLAPIACKVARVARFGDRAVSEVTCDREEGWKFIVAGIYFATPKGLFRYNSTDWPTSLADMGKDTDHVLLVAASPKATTQRVKEGEQGGPRYTLTHTVRRENGAWCASESTSGAPHDGTSTTCYGGVITRGRNDIGGELNDLSYRTR